MYVIFVHRSLEESSEIHGKLDLSQLLAGSPFLRVIDLEGLDIGKELPKEIGNIVHLHYLGVRCRLLKRVPSSIRSLVNLQTLDVRDTGIRKLPNSFWNITTLHHVLGDELHFPKSAGDLKLLQTLETVTIHYVNKMFGAILRKMIGLRFLHVIGLDETHTQALKDALEELSFLESLKLSGSVIQMDFTNASFEQLKYIELEGKLDLMHDYITSTDSPNDSPSTIGKAFYLLNLTHLVLKSTHVNQGFIDMISYLPVLVNLVLLDESYDGEELVFHCNRFKCLCLLKICCLTKLKKLVVQNWSIMQKFDTVQLIDVPGLRIEDPNNLGSCKRIEQYTSRRYN